MTFSQSGDIIEERRESMNILAASASSWTLDVVFFALLLLGLLFGVWRGFVKGICKLAGTIFSVIFAFTFCIPMKNQLDSWFGLTSAMGGTTAAGWGAVVISFVVLVILIKLGAWLIGKLGTLLVNKFGPVKVINKILGGLLGLVKALLFIFILLAIFRWVNAASINNFIANSAVVGKIYNSSWFIQAFHAPR